MTRCYCESKSAACCRSRRCARRTKNCSVIRRGPGIKIIFSGGLPATAGMATPFCRCKTAGARGVANAEVRCAIYTRKSTEEGLSQEFNSLDAQREAAESYIQSQRGLGWKLIPTRYDDGGFSGGNLDRPALQQLLADVDSA